ncbi:MAG: dual specificity protein phosphatase family protein [Candidatus Heimdallarchaeota archaeon]|nr:MAG: dual specificity protein phosphatase family protein [Candidatus Heimdallarchaeota archaeon]
MFLYWVDQRKRFAGSSEPILEDLPFLKTIEWAGIICLQENPTSEELATLLAVPYLHLPIQDFSIPTETDLESVLEFFHEIQRDSPDLPILIHCSEGHGRTGTILAALLVVIDHISPEDAIQQVRGVNPLAIESKKQENFIINL